MKKPLDVFDSALLFPLTEGVVMGIDTPPHLAFRHGLLIRALTSLDRLADDGLMDAAEVLEEIAARRAGRAVPLAAPCDPAWN